MILTIAYILTGLFLALKLGKLNKLLRVIIVAAWPIVVVVLILMELAAIKQEN